MYIETNDTVVWRTVRLSEKLQ